MVSSTVDGALFGSLSGISIATNGVVTAQFSNGLAQKVYKIPIATFSNPDGLSEASGNAYLTSIASGSPTITEADLVMFVGTTGMVEVIFTDHTFGSESGAIQGRFVPAALTYSLVEGLLCQSMIQGTGLAMLEMSKKVLKPVRVGDTVHGEVEVLSVRPTSKGGRGIMASRVDIKNQHGAVVISYEATRMLAGKSK